MEAVNVGSSGFAFRYLQDSGVKSGTGLRDHEVCSTAVPSPAFTSKSFGPSPAVSPKEGYASSAWAVDQFEFTLPDACESGSPALDDDSPFELTGLDDLQKNLAGLLAKLPAMPEAKKVEATLEPPPGLEPPAGIAPPPGLNFEPEERAAPAAAPKNENPLPLGCTTAMLRNIPNKYTQEMLIDRLHEDGFKGELDFIYLPIDFKNRCNFGYGFVNFRTPEACERFAEAYHLVESQVRLPGFRSRKVIEVSPARHQGLEENVARLQHSPVLTKLVSFGKPEWLPKLLGEHGEVIEVLHPTKTPDAPQKRN
mmetsp:Transcript_3705/g.9570  ORF Transcript_3705/g.9570 Transcript_3705/m.9570 type:complete len:310 (-) Transcript_3705:327-1256(-)